MMHIMLKLTQKYKPKNKKKFKKNNKKKTQS